MGTVCILSGCENDLSKVNTISSKLFEVSVETSRGIEITYSDSTKVKAVLSSPLLMSYATEEPYDLMPEGLKVVFYNDSLQVESTLTAKYGRRDLEKKTMEVRDSVVVISSDGRKLETERLVWEEEGDRIYSDRFVKITAANGDISQGSGIETNSSFDPYRLLSYSGDITIENDGSDSLGRDSLGRPGSTLADSLPPGASPATPPAAPAPDTSGNPE